VPRLFEEGYPNETSIGFEPGGTMLCLLRRDGEPSSGLVGWARPPYRDWTWQELGVRIGGPHWLRVPGAGWLAAARQYEPSARTVLAWVEPGTGGWQEVLELPSGGDTSYAGMVREDDRLWVSYYSSHEGRTSVYLAEVDLLTGPQDIQGGPLTRPPGTLSPGGGEGESVWPQLAGHFDPPSEWANKTGDYRSPLRFEDGTEVSSTGDWERRRDEILAVWHGAMGEWPALLERPRCEVLRTETEPEYVRHRVRVEIAADLFEEGWLMVPHGRGPFAAVVVPYYEPETSVGLSGREGRDLARQLTRSGLVTLSIGSPGGDARRPDPGRAGWQPLSFLAYVGANLHTVLAQRPEVDADRIGIAGHSYGGKWALFAACLHRPYAAVAVSDPGVVWDESRGNVNYWEPWYLGQEPGTDRKPGLVSVDNPRTGAYRRLREAGRDLHELHALLAPRPLFVAGGAEDGLERWEALNHLVAVNELLGFSRRVGLSTRAGHDPTPESNAALVSFFGHFLRR
jgi:hypothetical protein